MIVYEGIVLIVIVKCCCFPIVALVRERERRCLYIAGEYGALEPVEQERG